GRWPCVLLPRRGRCGPRIVCWELVEREAGEAAEDVAVAGRRRSDDLRRQVRRRRFLVPLARGDEAVQEVPHGLLVQRGLAAADRVLVLRPEAGGVRRQHLVDQEQRAVRELAELELRVRDDDALLGGQRAPALVDGEAAVAERGGQLLAHALCHLRERDVLVVALLGLGRGREDRRVQPLALDEP